MRTAVSVSAARRRLQPPVAAGLAPTEQRRTLINAFMRPPTRASIPSKSPSGETIDRDKFIMEYTGVLDALKMSQVADEINILDNLPGFEPIRVSDLIFGLPDTYIPMPRFGIEHRLPELAETMRQVRAAGALGSTQEIFQVDDDVRVATGDLLSLPGIVFCARTPRTNDAAIKLIRSAHFHKPDYKAFLSAIVDFNLEGDDPDPPYLADVCGFAGQNCIIVSDDEYGNRAAKMLATEGKIRPWYFCRVEPGVQWLSWYAGGMPNNDILMTDESDVSLQSAVKAGLNPIPVEWEEGRKLGLTLRSVVLGLVFMKKGGGNVMDTNPFTQTTQRVFTGDKRVDGDKGAPFWAQVRNYELPPFVEQPVPRYKPPMHKPGGQIVKVRPGQQRTDEARAEKAWEADKKKNNLGVGGVLPGTGAGQGGRQ